MNEPIRILIVEDLPTDAELAEREIRQALGACVFRRVETRPDYLAALELVLKLLQSLDDQTVSAFTNFAG